MLKHGSTVIFNNDYIEELIRHRDIAKRKYDVENLPKEKEQAKRVYEHWEQKLQWAEEFQDTIEEIKNMSIPNLTAIKTMGGHEYPIKYLQVI